MRISDWSSDVCSSDLFADWRGHPGQARDLSVTTTTHFTRKKLRVGSALQALALLGAGFTISAALTAPASAQDYTNVTASGRVVSVNGGPVAGATVEVISDAQGFTRTVTTNNSGAYRIAQIPPGSYTFAVSAPGYQTYTEAGVILNQSGAANQFALVSEAAEAGGDIVVTAGRIEVRSEEHTSELQSLMRISYAVFCLKKKKEERN